MTAAVKVREVDTSSTEVAIVIDRDHALAALTDPAQFDAFYEKVKAETDKLVPDVTTAKGRKDIAAMAFKVTKTKTAIDKAGQELTEEWRKSTAKVDASRRVIREKLDALRDQVREPLTQWEAAEEQRIAECQRQMQALTSAAVVSLEDTSETVGARLNEVRGRNLDPTLFGDEIDLAQQRRDHAVATLTAALERLRQEEADRAELVRLRAEAEERERVEAQRREEEAREREAAERRQREEAEAAERQAREDRERAEAEARAREEREAAAAREEQARQEAAAHAQREAEERAAAEQRRRDEEHEAALAAERRRADEAEEARRAEQERAERERRQRADTEAEMQRLAAARQADIAHRSTIMGTVKDALIEHCTLDEATAKDVVRAISAKLIPYTAIDFAQQLDLKAAPGRCEEASPMSGERYIPCNAPAVSMIGWAAGGEGPYRMCASCAEHNVRNRGAELLGPFVADAA